MLQMPNLLFRIHDANKITNFYYYEPTWCKEKIPPSPKCTRRTNYDFICDCASISISILGRFAANCSYTILNLFSAEQFPTVVRGVGVGFCVVVSRLGTIMAPYILLLGRYAPCLFGVSAFLAGLASLLLPETLGETMPETLLDGEELELSLPFKNCKKSRELSSIQC